MVCSTCYLYVTRRWAIYSTSPHAEFEVSCISENFLNTSCLQVPYTVIHGFVCGVTNEFLRETNFCTAGELINRSLIWGNFSSHFCPVLPFIALFRGLTSLGTKDSKDFFIKYTTGNIALKEIPIKLSSSGNYTNVSISYYVVLSPQWILVSRTRTQDRHPWSKWAALCRLPWPNHSALLIQHWFQMNFNLIYMRLHCEIFC